jgi:DNA modification methylase
MKQIKLMQGDNILSLKKLPENSIDSIVTDPPYGLSFMNKKWDYEVPSVEFWQEVLRVLKPGGHVLSFGGTRTYHRMVVNMEDAGFEIRDQIMWIYGSGFPKSLNIGKAFDKKNGDERKIIGRKIQRVDGTLRKVGATGAPFVDKDGKSFSKPTDGYIDIEEPGSETSKKWEGWGTALKPANEPICLARKPLSEKTIVDNVIKWGTGVINIDGCRIATDDELGRVNKTDTIDTDTEMKMGLKAGAINFGTDGRFPANILFDETAAEMLDEQSGISKSSKFKPEYDGGFGVSDIIGKNKKIGGSLVESERGFSDKGGASRFFYVPKVSKKERNLGLDGFEDKETTGQLNLNKCIKCNKYYMAGDGRELCSCIEPEYNSSTIQKNNHPTLKPINLMTYLCRLITPPGGIVLDPFMGSGSTGISACLEGFRFVGMELDEDYFKIAEARVNNFEEYRKLLK